MASRIDRIVLRIQIYTLLHICYLFQRILVSGDAWSKSATSLCLAVDLAFDHLGQMRSTDELISMRILDQHPRTVQVHSKVNQTGSSIRPHDMAYIMMK